MFILLNTKKDYALKDFPWLKSIAKEYTVKEKVASNQKGISYDINYSLPVIETESLEKFVDFMMDNFNFPYEIGITRNVFFISKNSHLPESAYVVPDDFPEVKYIIYIKNDDNDYNMEDMED